MKDKQLSIRLFIFAFMKNLLTEKRAAYSVLFILSLIIGFHLLIISDLLPHTIVWGGRMTNRSELIRFELISIGANAFMLLVILIRAKIINVEINAVVLKILLWLMAGLFILNTVGNLLSKNEFERITFTPLTILLSIFCIKLALSTKQANPI